MKNNFFYINDHYWFGAKFQFNSNAVGRCCTCNKFFSWKETIKLGRKCPHCKTQFGIRKN